MFLWEPFCFALLNQRGQENVLVFIENAAGACQHSSRCFGLFVAFTSVGVLFVCFPSLLHVVSSLSVNVSDRSPLGSLLGRGCWRWICSLRLLLQVRGCSSPSGGAASSPSELSPRSSSPQLLPVASPRPLFFSPPARFRVDFFFVC